MEITSIATTSWVYNFKDYVAMYDLSKEDLKKSMIDFPARISSFNAEATEKKLNVVSADPLYHLPPDKMFARAHQLLAANVAHLKETRERLRNASDTSLQQVIELWQHTEQLFLKDYALGCAEKRYIAANLPTLPFQMHQFELSLCTDLMFYHALSSDNIITLFRALSYVASEIRIYPFLDHHGKMTQELGPLMLWLQKNNFGVEVREVPYTIQKGGNAMLRVWSNTCEVK